ncbi:MAG TPA: response regulator [Candidatus Kapabacteria bacterium]|jgi:CheY-like chemotaxis protein|nr:response regulator [Candidatus Kapabacteria bacterium]
MDPKKSDPILEHFPAASQHRGHILLVDDHRDTSLTLKILLERRGYKVTTAHSLAHGLERARELEFDLLVSDIGLPDGDGYDLLQAIHKERPMKAIAISGFTTDGDLERSRNAGFHHHLKKPFAFSELERAIADLLP